jgi:hypothetical protein
MRAALAVLREKEDLVSIGAYQPGSDPALDTALAHRAGIEGFLRQTVQEHSEPHDTDARLLELAALLSGHTEHLGEDIPDAEEVPSEQPADPPVSSLQGSVEAPAIPALGLNI